MNNIVHLSQFDFEKNNLFNCLREHLGEQEFLMIFAIKIDEILFDLLSAVRDDKDFQEKFKSHFIFVKSSEQNINIGDFYRAIDIIEVRYVP